MIYRDTPRDSEKFTKIYATYARVTLIVCSVTDSEVLHFLGLPALLIHNNKYQN